MAQPFFLEERRRMILERLKRDGRVAVKTLSETLNVSEVTIRQDLRALEENGLLERTYGGAVLRGSPTAVVPELSFDLRRRTHHVEKVAIGKAAAALVKDGYSVALDSSSTSFEIAQSLKQLDNLTVVTNSLILAQQFLDRPDIQVILPGGRLRRESVSLVGNPTSYPIINLNIGFFGARGATLEAGITEASIQEAEAKRAMIDLCRTTVIVLDSSKWGHIAPYTFLEAHEARYITTEKASPELVEAFRAAGIEVNTVALG